MTRPFVPIQGPLSLARFVHRPNRFLLQVRLEDTGDVVEAHMADPGRLKELLIPGRRVWLQPASNPHRKTRWSAVLTEAPDGVGLVSIDTGLPNRLIHAALQAGAMEEFSQWELVRREYPLGRSRFDFLLEEDETQGRNRKLVLEVKSVTLVEDGVALFPDAVTERGARHVLELAEIARRHAWEAAILFVLQRSDAGEIRAARSIDERFADALSRAAEAGVHVYGRRCRVAEDGMELGERVEVTVG